MNQLYFIEHARKAKRRKGLAEVSGRKVEAMTWAAIEREWTWMAVIIGRDTEVAWAARRAT